MNHWSSVADISRVSSPQVSRSISKKSISSDLYFLSSGSFNMATKRKNRVNHASMLLCFYASMLLCFYANASNASMLPCFYASLLLWLSLFPVSLTSIRPRGDNWSHQFTFLDFFDFCSSLTSETSKVAFFCIWTAVKTCKNCLILSQLAYQVSLSDHLWKNSHIWSKSKISCFFSFIDFCSSLTSKTSKVAFSHIDGRQDVQKKLIAIWNIWICIIKSTWETDYAKIAKDGQN